MRHSQMIVFALLHAFAQSACAHPSGIAGTPSAASPRPSPHEAQAMPATVTLAPGQKGAIAGGSLHYLRLLTDSRCPPDVYCVWAGDAVIELDFTAAGSGHALRFQLHTGKEPRSHALADGLLRLEMLSRDPAPIAKFSFQPSP